MEADDGSELKQKLSIMAAELCSMKAVDAQMTRKMDDAVHAEKKAQFKISKLDKEVALQSTQITILTKKVQTLESSNELLQRQKVDLHNQIEEVHRDKSDTKYKQERLMF